MTMLPILSTLRAGLRSRRWQISAGVSLMLVTLLIAGLLILRQRQFAAPASAPAAACAANVATLTVVPPGVTLPVKIPTGEPRVVATVNGDPLCAEELELRVAGTLANHRQQLQQLPAASHNIPAGTPPNVLAILQETPNQVRHDALTQMIQERLLVQEGKRLGLTASVSAAQAMARQVLQRIRSLPASDPARISFASYLNANHLNEQTFLTDPGILHAYADTLTMAAVKQHIVKGLPAGESPTSAINASIQHLWQTGQVRVYLPAQLGW